MKSKDDAIQAPIVKLSQYDTEVKIKRKLMSQNDSEYSMRTKKCIRMTRELARTMPTYVYSFRYDAGRIEIGSGIVIARTS